PDQRSLVQAPADGELVPGRGVADVLQLVLILIGPERVHVVVGIARPEYRPGRRAAVFLGIVVVLNPHPAKQRVEVIRDITGRVDIGRGRPALLVGEQSVVLRGRAAGHGRDDQVYPDAGDDE